DLARSVLHLVGAQRQAELRELVAQELDHRVDEVVAMLGEKLVARREERDFGRRARLACVLRQQAFVDDLEDVELDLEAGDEFMARRRELLQRGAEQAARAERRRT